MGYLNDDYTGLSPLKTDMYQLTMAQGYFDQGRQDEEVSFYMHWRKPPFDGGYTTAAGLEGVVDFIRNLKFTDEHIDYLRTFTKPDANGVPQRLYSEEFLAYLKDLEPDIQIDAVPEGTAMLSSGPVVRVTTTLPIGQLVESAILALMNPSSMIATRASRLDDITNDYSNELSTANRTKKVADFSLRRAAAFDSSVARSSYIGGTAAVADVEAAYKLGIPATGTMAHAWVMGFRAAVKGYEEAKAAGNEDRWISPYVNSPERDFFEGLVRKAVDDAWPNVTNSEVELVAFKAYLRSMPNNSVLLVDTFDTMQGVQNAIKSAIEMNCPLQGIRLDSGDIYADSFKARELIDTAKTERPDLFSGTGIYVTDGLNEQKIAEMENRAKAEGKVLPFNFYGVGTKLGNPGPFDGGVYKVCANEIVQEADEIAAFDTVRVGDEDIAITRTMMGTMKVASDPENPTLPSAKSSIPGAKLNTLRLLDAEGMIIADVVIDEALRPELKDASAWLEALKSEGIVNEKGETQHFGNAVTAETLLKPIFQRKGRGRAAEYVYPQHGAPGKVDTFTGQPAPDVPNYEGGPKRTNLVEIQEYARAQRAALPMERREIHFDKQEKSQAQPLYMDPKVFEARKEILAGMAPRTPGADVSGDLTAQGQGRSKEI